MKRPEPEGSWPANKRCLLGAAVVLAVIFGGVGVIAAGRAAEEEQASGLVAAPLQDATVLILRHAEKPAEGRGLSLAGERRAASYVKFFRAFKIDGQPAALDYLVAAADSKNSERSRLTLEPLAAELGLKVESRFKNTQYRSLAEELRTHFHGKEILICWQHGEIPDLLRALGANPNKLLPKGHWPDHEFSWILELRYDASGNLLPKKTRRIVPDLKPGSAGL